LKLTRFGKYRLLKDPTCTNKRFC